MFRTTRRTWRKFNDDGTPNKNYGRVSPVYDNQDTTNKRSYGYVLSMATNINKDLRFIADYAKTDADFQNNSIALRLNYKDADYKPVCLAI